MPCQCSTTAFAEADTMTQGCGCATESADGCACADDGAPTPSDHARSLERVVMDLDKRLRRLEAGR